MFENILYATDFSESPFMLPCIGIIGKTKRIHLLHVVSEDTQIDPKLIEPRMQEAKNFLEEKLKGIRDVEVDVHLTLGVPAREICGIAKKLDASLVVINYHGEEGYTGSATADLIKYCDRNLLVMTKLASDTVDRSEEAMSQYCTSLFRRVVTPTAGDTSSRLKVLQSVKEETSLGSVVFSGFSDNTYNEAETLAGKAKEVGISAEAAIKKGIPWKSIISVAEEADASLILLDAMIELGLALTLSGISDFPLLILKKP